MKPVLALVILAAIVGAPLVGHPLAVAGLVTLAALAALVLGLALAPVRGELPSAFDETTTNVGTEL